MLNPNWLKTFVTLVETGHFTQTAEKLFMTQPGVSQHISKLEIASGYSLIKRDKKSFELTEQGRLVYQYALDLAENEHELLARLAFDEPFKGICSLASSGSLALKIYPELLTVQQIHPQLIVKFKAAPNHQILEEIQTGKLDLAIITDLPNLSLFDVTELGFEPLCIVLPSSISNVINPNLLIELGMIDHPDAKHYLSLYMSQSQDEKLISINIEDIPISGCINQISQILEPVAKGLGFTVLPKSAVDSFSESDKLQIFPLKKPIIQTLYMVKKRNRSLPARFDVVTSALNKYFDAKIK